MPLARFRQRSLNARSQDPNSRRHVILALAFSRTHFHKWMGILSSYQPSRNKCKLMPMQGSNYQPKSPGTIGVQGYRRPSLLSELTQQRINEGPFQELGPSNSASVPVNIRYTTSIRISHDDTTSPSHTHSHTNSHTNTHTLTQTNRVREPRESTGKI